MRNLNCCGFMVEIVGILKSEKKKKSKPVMRTKVATQKSITTLFVDILTLLTGLKVTLRQESLFNSYCNVSSATNLHHLLSHYFQIPDISRLFESGDSTRRQNLVSRHEVSVNKFSNAPLSTPQVIPLLSCTRSRTSFRFVLLALEQEFQGWRCAVAIAHSTPGQS